MRLLNTTTFEQKEFLSCSTDLPEYAILSHTWGEEEILFNDIQQPREAWIHKKGAQKVIDCCRLAEQNGYDWCWIDTCNIDKSSSSELSEAINSMYEWYERSLVCYVYLSDVEFNDENLDSVEDESVDDVDDDSLGSLGYDEEANSTTFGRSRCWHVAMLNRKVLNYQPLGLPTFSSSPRTSWTIQLCPTSKLVEETGAD